MTGLAINILGPYSVTLDGQPLPGFRTRLAQALFLYLACEPERHRREHLMALFWPGLPQASAQQNLRQNLYLLRRAVPEVESAGSVAAVPLVLADTDSLLLNPAAAVVVDARRFAALSDRIRPGLGELEEMVALYRGDFLADFYLPDSNPFEEWASARREAYRRGALLALERLAAIHLTDEAFTAAETYARRQLAIDPLHEAGNRQLIEILARGGRRSAALAHFDDYRRLLNVELGVKPGSETLALVTAVQGGELLPVAHRPDHIRGYDIHEELGRGSYGVVFRASQPSIGRHVAVKVIPARYADDIAFIRRFEAEAQTIARLEHPQIVPLYDYWREPGSAYLVMRYLRGGNLKAALDGAPWPPERVAHLLDQMAAALAVAHRHSVVHRDVKPANILLDEDGNAYLTDFGIAKLLRSDGSTALSQEMFAGTPEYVSPEQALNEDVTPLSDQYSLGLVAYEALSGRPPFVAGSLLELLEKHVHESAPPLVQWRPDVPTAVDNVLARALAKRPGERFPDVVAFAAAFRAAIGGGAVAPRPSEPLLDVANPYKGLLAFNEADAALFFGREALTGQLVARLAESGPHHRFLAVVGPSGSGKSSLVKAGLVPALRRGALPGADKWFVLDMVPGAHPFEELETALLRVAVNPPASLLAQLQDGERGLLRAVRRTLPPDESSELVLIIGQFEELFTLVSDREVTARFLNSLITAVSDPRSLLRVVATLRADFYDRPLLHPALSEVVQQRTEVVIPMTPDELVRAIERPAARVGVGVEPQLVAALVADVNEQPGALPLLQYTLSELFEGQAGGRLTLDAYHALGGISGALAQRAEAVYAALDAAGQTATRALFSRLVTLGEGVEDTRRRVLRAELMALGVAGEQGISLPLPRPLAPPLDQFGHARLLSFDRDPVTRGPTVEIAHEALLRAWPRLRGWLDEDRAALRLSRLLTAAAAEWQAAGQAEGFLLRGARLDQMAPLAGGVVALTGSEHSLLEASLKARQARQSAEEARQQAELATARKLAETERRRADEQANYAGRLRRRAGLLAGAMALALLLALMALTFARSSARNADIAATREAEALANAGLASTREAEAFASAALAATREGEAQAEAGRRTAAEAEANAQRDLALDREREARESYSLSLAANARQALAADDQPLALLLALAANEIENPPLDAWRTLVDVAYAPGAVRDYEAGSFINNVDVSADGRTMLTSSDDGLVRLWDVESGELLREYEGATDLVQPIAFSPDERTALGGTGDGEAILWDVATGEVIRRLTANQNDIRAIAFMPDGRHALTGEDPGLLPGEMILWDLATGDIIRRYGADLGDGIENVRSIAIDPEGRRALVGYGKTMAAADYSAILYDIESGDMIRALDGANRSINDVAISPDGRLGYGASASGTVFVWDLDTGETLRNLDGHNGLAISVAVSPDGRTVMAGAFDGAVIQWNIATGQIINRFAQSGPLWGLDFRDNSSAVTGTAEGYARLWDLSGRWLEARWEDPQSPRAATGADAQILITSISPDGRYAISSAAEQNTWRDPALTLWDYETGQPVRRFDIGGNLPFEAAFTPDSRQVLVGFQDATLGLYDVESGALLRRLTGHLLPVQRVDISSDGRHALTGSGGGEIFYWDLESGELLHRMRGHFLHTPITDVHILPGDRLALSSSADNTPVLWDLTTGEQIRRFTGFESPIGGHQWIGQLSTYVTELAVMHSGRQFLSANEDGLLVLWDTASGQPIRRFTGHAQSVTSVSVTPDGRRALSGAVNDPIILWDVATGRPIRRFPLLEVPSGNFAPRLAIHPDGLTALADDADGTLLKWRLAEPDPAELIPWLATNRITRELTCLERETYRIEPLCVDGQPAETTADMMAAVRQATATLVVAEPADEALAAPPDLHSPARPPHVAVLGENQGELARGEFDVWTYEGTAGELLSLRLVADRPLTDWALPVEQRFETGVLDSVVHIIDPEGRSLDFSVDELLPDLTRLSDARILGVRLPADGVYQIEARSALDDQGARTSCQWK